LALGALAVSGLWYFTSARGEDPLQPPARTGDAATPASTTGSATKSIPLKTATSSIKEVTIYQRGALVSREVIVPEGSGLFEVVVPNLPPQTQSGSLFSEGSETIRVLNTRYRTRATREDTREEVRKLQNQLKDLAHAQAKLQSDVAAVTQNLAMLTKLESFTAVSTEKSTDKGTLIAENSIAMTKFIMEQRAEKSAMLVGLQKQIADNKEVIDFVQRQVNELSAGSSRTEHEGVILLDKSAPSSGKIMLHYLVTAATWRPTYKFRASLNEKDPVTVEYLAAIQQQTGEDWTNVDLTLSTAQPMLNAAPPHLSMLEITASGAVNPMAQNPGPAFKDLDMQRRNFRQQGQELNNSFRYSEGGKALNDAAAAEQTWQLLVSKKEQDRNQKEFDEGFMEGQSVTFRLKKALTLPSRNDDQVLEITKLTLQPDYYYKSVPVLTKHVYRLANLVNKTEFVLLPGEATMCIGQDYVGRARLPLVAIGEQFTAGFGVDPQLQVQRVLVDREEDIQGGNKVFKFNYRILVSSYKKEPVRMEVWDRLPHAEGKAIGITLLKQSPELSADPLYVREEKTKNLLRWDITVKPGMINENAFPITYDFKIEMERNMHIGNLLSK
jgi:uncharacterized protein (TIGR02231 family)